MMEAFVTHDKITMLVKDLLVAETWKAQVFPMIKPHVCELSSLKSYICMYHESSVCNLLEVMLYHRSACENADDALVELIDYCARKFINMNNQAKFYEDRRNTPSLRVDPKTILNQTADQEIDKQSTDIEFSCSMIAFSLIRFITDHLSDLSVPIVHQLMEASDMPCALVPLLELKPWLRKNAKGEMEKFED